MDEDARYTTTLKCFVGSVMLQLEPCLAKGSKVHFKIPLGCMPDFKKGTLPDYIARVYSPYWLRKETPPSYIEFDAVAGQFPKPNKE